MADIARQWLLLDDPTHEAPQRDWSLPRGVLRRRPVRGAVELTDVVGKEGAKIDAGPLALILDDEDLTSTFLESNEWYSLVLPVLIAAREARIASESSVPRGTVRYTLEGRSPSPEHYRDTRVSGRPDRDSRPCVSKRHGVEHTDWSLVGLAVVGAIDEAALRRLRTAAGWTAATMVCRVSAAGTPQDATGLLTFRKEQLGACVLS
ncbi:MAG: hypothetical protein ABSA65_10790 [Acidimicrobiales bacterium]